MINIKIPIKNIFLLFLICWGSYISAPAHSYSYLFAHGLADTQAQAHWYSRVNPDGTTNQRYLIDGPLITFDFPDSTTWFWRVNFTQTSLAQTNEILALKKAFDSNAQSLKMYKNSHDIILMGLSRGASTIINFMGLFNPPQVKLLLLESPFDCTKTLSDNMLKKVYLDKIPGMKTVGHATVSGVFMQHSRNGLRPIDMVANIKKDLPIIIICTTNDGTVPVHSSIAVYIQFLLSGHRNTHLLVFIKGKHGRIIQSEQGQDYQDGVHAIYQHYGFPHNPEFAQRGQLLLQHSQPTPEKLTPYLQK